MAQIWVRRIGFGTILCQISLFAGPALAQTDCTRDFDGDGHPLFGVTLERADLELLDGVSLSASGTGLCFADVDGDGDLDAVCVVNHGIDDIGRPRSAVSVLRNRGDGVFDGPERYDLGDEEVTARIGDFNRDGHPDIGVAVAMENSLGILLNRGDGTFDIRPLILVGVEPRSLIVADFDGDGDDDVCVINSFSSDVSILLCNGDGTFADEVRIGVPNVTPRGDGNRNFPFPGAHGDAADLDGDGDIDLLIPASRHAHILLGDGEGGFEPAQTHPRNTGGRTYNIKVRDLDGDGDLDLAATIAHPGLGLFGVWINDGTGTFGEATIYNTSFFGDGRFYFFVALALGDIDGDGDLDMVQGGEASDYAYVMFNNGDGTFDGLDAIEDGNGAWVLEFADVNADGFDDLGSFNTRRGSLRVRLGDRRDGLHGVRAPTEEQDIRDIPAQIMVASGDLDGDGDADLISGEWGVPGHYSRRLRVLRNDGAESLVQTHTLHIKDPPGGEHAAAIVVDIDGDGLGDIVATFQDDIGDEAIPGRLHVLINLGDMTFAAPRSVLIPDSIPDTLTHADFDGDGDIDVACFARELRRKNNEPRLHRILVFENDGNGNLTETERFELGLSDNSGLGGVVGGDVDGDGDIDLVSGWTDREIEGPAWLMRNDGTGSFVQEAVAILPPFTRRIVMDDFDGDGDPDFAVTRKFGSEVIPYLAVYTNDGSGAFELDQEFIDPNVSGNAGLRAVDINLDGAVDIVIGEETDGIVVHLNDGGGDFSNRGQYSAFDGIINLTVADFTGDGRPDVIGTSNNRRSLVILEGTGCGFCGADLSGSDVPGERLYGVPDGVLDIADFFFYLDAFAAGNTDIADLTGSNDPNDPGYGVPDGVLDAADFMFYLALFADGCG